MINSIVRHIREGTWAEGLSIRINRLLNPYIQSAHRKARNKKGIQRFNILDQEEAVSFLLTQARHWHAKYPGIVLVAGNASDSNFKSFLAGLKSNGLNSVHFHGEGSGNDSNSSGKNISCIISTYFTAKENHELLQIIFKDQRLIDIPFEYVGDALTDYSIVRKHNIHESLHFISPLLIDKIPYLQIYDSSLSIFEKKCDIRDYMDLCQWVAHVTRQHVPGDICEFGSYKGHSGYLLSRLLEAEKSDKQLYMFDMFEHFPDESVGVDAFWSQTHNVDFQEVKAKFKDRPNTTLIKGDFTETLSAVNIDKMSLIYVDCDSYRATLFLMKELFEKKLSEKGIMIFEDYGHPALLGNRLAVHEFFEGRTDCIKFFSQFSGYYIVIKST